MDIRKMEQNEFTEGLELAWSVFQSFEAPDYSEQGVQAFYTSLHDPEFVNRLQIYGAFDGPHLVGLLATRECGGHIALFFVKGERHRQGIGKALFQLALETCPHGTLTVNSSPYAVEVYRRLGFVDTDTEQMTDGIRYTPMAYRLKN